MGKKERGINEQEATGVRVESWEHELIRQIVGENRLGSSLIEILELNRISNQKAIFFTDGSLKDKTSMGFGGLLTNEEMKDSLKSFNGSIENWCSSTRPELAAILCAMLATPCNKEVEIYTDSSSAILEVEKLRDIAKARDWAKKNNSTLLIAMHKTLITKELIMSLHKVKAHAGIELNEAADDLAKKGVQSEEKIILRGVVSRDAAYRLSFRGITIECPVRTLFKKVLSAQVEARWAFPSNKNSIAQMEKSRDRDWKVFWELLKTHQKPEIYTTRTDQAWMFRIKCINRLLPTLERKKLYTKTGYSKISCRKCEKEAESMEHLTECTQDQGKWRDIEREVIEKVFKEMKENVKEKICSSLLNRTLGWEEESTLQSISRRKNLARGIIPNETRENLQAEGLHRKEAIKLTVQLWNKWIEAFYEEIWKPRCQVTAEWEKKEGIKHSRKTRQEKPRKGKKKKPSPKEKNIQICSKTVGEERKREEEEKIREIGLEEVCRWIKGVKTDNWCKT